MRIELAKKLKQCTWCTQTHMCENALKCENTRISNKWSLVPPKDRDRQIFPMVSPHGLTHKFSLNAANPRQSSAQTISCPELLTVSLAGGPQSYSTQRDFSIKRSHGGNRSGSGLRSNLGKRRTRKTFAKQTDHRSDYKQTPRHSWIEVMCKKEPGVPWCGRVTRSVAGG